MTFSMRLLHFRRTFVEKMFAIHSKVELLKRDAQPIGSYARHYYDLFQLSSQPEVVDMLASPEYATIKADYDQISRTHFAKSYFFPEAMSFSRSDALFPPAELASVIGPQYEAQCRVLCYALTHPGRWCWVVLNRCGIACEEPSANVCMPDSMDGRTLKRSPKRGRFW